MKQEGPVPLRPFTAECLVVGMLSTDERLRIVSISRMEQVFGRCLAQHGPYPFSYTHYYDDEMGGPIERWYGIFERLQDPGRLPELKHTTMMIEDDLRIEGRRKINLDPGLLSMNRFVLASTKDRGHRIPLHSGIFGEVTLVYVHGAYRELSWTYADYRSETCREILAGLRTTYQQALKEQRMIIH